jgi:AmiR/NasT family two-component response regulator
VKEMFEVNSTSEDQISDQKLSSHCKKSDRKPKPHSFTNLTTVLQSWQPSDPLALRRILVNEILMVLEQKEYNCTRSCIPAIIVDKQYPVDMLHYQSEQDIDEFITRMLWMRQEFNSAIGIFLGIPDEAIAAKVEEAYEGMMMADEDCVVLLM